MAQSSDTAGTRNLETNQEINTTSKIYESPGSSKDTQNSTEQPQNKSKEDEITIDETSQDISEHQESVKVRTWHEEKMRRNRWRRIYGTDMFQNDGEIKREKGISRSLSDMSAKRLNSRKRLTRKLSELVLVPPEATEEKEEQQPTLATLPSGDPLLEEIEAEELINKTEETEIKHQTTEVYEDKNRVSQKNAFDNSIETEKLGDEGLKEKKAGIEVSGETKVIVLERKDELTDTAHTTDALSLEKSNSVHNNQENNCISSINWKESQETTSLTQDVDGKQLTENGSLKTDKLSRTENKVTLKDLYREIKLMRQVVQACAIPVLSEVTETTNSQNQKRNIAELTPAEEIDNDRSNRETNEEDKNENDEMEIQRVQEANKAPATPSLSELCDNDNASIVLQDQEDDKTKQDSQTEEDENDPTEDKEDAFDESEKDLHRSRSISETDDDNEVPSICKNVTEQQKKAEKEDFTSVGGSTFQDNLSSQWDACWSSAKDKAIRVVNDRDEVVLGCVLHMSTDIPEDASVDCVILDPSEIPTITGIYEILVSNIVEISPIIVDSENKDLELAIGIPFLKYEMKYFQEPSLRYLDNSGQWQDGFFAESIYRTEDDIDVPILLTRLSSNFTFAVVAKPVIDDVLFSGEVSTFHSTVDNDISLSCPTSIRINQMDVHVELKVLPVLPEVLEDTKQIFDVDVRRKLYSTGAVVTITYFDDPPQTIYVNLPCVKPPSPSRPVTGSRRVPSRLGTPDSGYRSASRRSTGRKSAFGRYIEPSQEKESHLIRFSDCIPTKVKRLTCEDVTDEDKVVFTVHEKSSTSVIVDITKGTKVDDIKTVVPPLLHSLEYQRVQVCIVHNRTRLNELNLLCDRRSKVDTRKIMKLEKENDITKSNVSLKEGDTVCLNFRGNVSSITPYKRIFRFYGIRGIHTAWKIGVVDRFAQRSLTTFCGFLQVFVGNVSGPYNQNMNNFDDKNIWRLLLEIPISLPKTEQIVSFKVSRAPVSVRMEGPISADFLEQLALCIGDEWPLLARYLRIEHPRLQSIMQQNKDQQSHLVRDVLLTWFKRSLFAKEKASTLIHALRYSGRSDLSERLRESYRAYRRERSRISKEQRLQKVISSVGKSEAVVQKWSELAVVLGFPEDEIDIINSDYNDDRTRCHKMLFVWKQRQKGHGYKKLIKSLREIGRNSVADYLVTFTTTKT